MKNKRKQCKGWKWRRFKSSNIPGMHKRSKTKDSIKSDKKLVWNQKE